MIFKANNDDNSSKIICAFNEIDRWNHPIICIIEISERPRLIDSTIKADIVVSTYGKKRFENFVNRAFKEHRILYVNKVKSQQLYARYRSQCPSSLLTTSFKNNVNAYKEIVNGFNKNG